MTPGRLILPSPRHLLHLPLLFSLNVRRELHQHILKHLLLNQVPQHMLLIQQLIKTSNCQTRLHVQAVKGDLGQVMNFSSTSTRRQRLTQEQRLGLKILMLKTIWQYAQLEHVAFQQSLYLKLPNISKYTTLDKNTSRQCLGQQLSRTYMSYQKTLAHQQIHTNVEYV